MGVLRIPALRYLGRRRVPGAGLPGSFDAYMGEPDSLNDPGSMAVLLRGEGGGGGAGGDGQEGKGAKGRGANASTAVSSHSGLLDLDLDGVRGGGGAH